MGFNNQVQHAQPERSSRRFIFKEGVHFRHMTGKDPILFRILPAIDPANADLSKSCLPFMLPGDVLTDWGMVLKVSRFIGHGEGKFGARQDVLSLRTFANDAEDIFDPLEQLLKVVSQMNKDWGYLLTDVKDSTGKVMLRAGLTRPMPHLLCNLWDLNRPTSDVDIGCFTSSAYSSLLDRQKGLAYQKASNLPDEIVQQNYLTGYTLGDLTDPVNGPALICQKGMDAGEYSRYSVTTAQDRQGRVIKRQLGPDLLSRRYDLTKPGTFLDIPSEEEIVATLAELFNQRSPTGQSELALLKMAFPQFRIPDPIDAPAAAPTVSTFVHPPETTPALTKTQTAVNTAPEIARPAAAAAPQDNLPGIPTPMTSAGPVAPGDNVGAAAFNKQSFLERLNAMRKQ